MGQIYKPKGKKLKAEYKKIKKAAAEFFRKGKSGAGNLYIYFPVETGFWSQCGGEESNR
jgi:hypothetical protein